MINYKKSRRESNAFDFELVSLNHSDRDMICFFSGNGAKRRYRFSLLSVCGEAGRKVKVHHEEESAIAISDQKSDLL